MNELKVLRVLTHALVLVALATCASCTGLGDSGEGRRVESPVQSNLTKDNAPLLQVVAIVTPPRPVGVFLIDRRHQPSLTYLLRPGESKNGVTLIRVNEDGNAVLVQLGGKSMWLHIGSRNTEAAHAK